MYETKSVKTVNTLKIKTCTIMSIFVHLWEKRQLESVDNASNCGVLKQRKSQQRLPMQNWRRARLSCFPDWELIYL